MQEGIAEASPALIAGRAEDPDQMLSAAEARALVLHALERIALPPRAVFVMHDLDETPMRVGWLVAISTSMLEGKSPARETLADGSVIDGRHRIERRLGGGGMGIVYAATHVGLDRRVAIKVLREQWAREAEVVERLAREARIVAQRRSTESRWRSSPSRP
jgi:hypothetical protein